MFRSVFLPLLHTCFMSVGYPGVNGLATAPRKCVSINRFVKSQKKTDHCKPDSRFFDIFVKEVPYFLK